MGWNRNSVGGSDGMTGDFYQNAWDIIEKEIHKIVVAFFCGFELPDSLLNTNFVMLPNKLVVNTF